MPLLRLAYATQFLIAVIAVFTLWGQVGGQNHLDMMPWWLKLGLGAGASFAIVKATMSAVTGEKTWNSGTLKWFGITLALLLGCGLTSYYFHVYEEPDEEDQQDTQTSELSESRQPIAHWTTMTLKWMPVLPILYFTSIAAAADLPPAQVQIAGAVLAAPAELRDGAAVLGYETAGGSLVQIRPGKNELICLASDPTKTAFNVACYHKDLEPFMARGRELIAQKVTGAKRNEVRFKEVEEGKLPMSKEPRTLYVLTGSSYDAATGKVQDPYLRWVIYVPFATPQSTGLSTKGSDGAPWLMSAGTAGAHIMINPPKK